MHLWKGELTYYGQCFILYTQTHERDLGQALYNFCYQIAKKTKKSFSSVRSFLMDGFDRYQITEVKKKGGIENG